MDMKICDIKVGENALRRVGNDESLADLVASIRRVGVLVPVVVAAEDEGYVLVFGHRRVRAAEIAGLDMVPVVVRECEQAERTEVAFAENLFRQDMSPVETGAAMKDVLQAERMSVDELAGAVHRSVDWVRKMVAMCDWPTDVLLGVHEGWLSAAAGSNLALVTEDEYRAFLVRTARENGATARITAAWLQAWRSMQPVDVAIAAPPVDGVVPIAPLVPQLPCIVCEQVMRMDAMSHVPVCPGCVGVLREVGGQLASQR